MANSVALEPNEPLSTPVTVAPVASARLVLPVRVVPVIAAGVAPPITAPSTVPALTSTELLVMIDTASSTHASLASFLIFHRFAVVSNHTRPAVRDVAGAVADG